MNFHAMYRVFEEKRQETVKDDSGINYSFFALINELNVKEIDFSRFSLEDLDYVETSMSWSYEDNNDGETFTLVKDHEYSKMLNLIQILFEVERAPKHFGPSPFSFL